ncbi:hypothetical protein ILUMI_18421 [Ignelater luminosus]|uniref:HAT C-terminal dimerisation domain-containing protein n=1 Tax=Ignelater luminosus TaxID=2038154 RepID=A0A8K0CP74_IGNLU|nr:hypothetical protein ILUMI_18421 [Ignelater luminosus]
MYSIYLDSSIQNKIVCTTTDNGITYLVHLNRVYENQELEERENEDDNDEEFIELTSLLEGDDYSTEIILPPHHRCACHTLHLIDTKDAEKVMINARYKQIFRSTFAKCHKLWAKQNQSTQAADKIKDMLGAYLKTPVVTRWNSLYDAMLQINNHITHVSDSINTCMDFCAFPRFTDAEREFIKEYCQVNYYIAVYKFNILGNVLLVNCPRYSTRRKRNVHGLPITCFVRLKDKLDAQIMKSLIYCKPLVQVLLEGIEYRQSIWWKKELVLASCVHPRFKLARLKDSEKREQAENWVYEEIPSPNPKMQTSGAADLEYNDSFCLTFNADVHTKTPHEQVKIFLSEQPKETDSFSCSALRKLFIKHNTALPTSASAERLFSFAGNVLSQKRCQLTDDITPVLDPSKERLREDRHISNCRKAYIRLDTIKAKFRRKAESDEAEASTSFSPVKKKLRGSEPAFNFKDMCMFCGETCDPKCEKKKTVKRRKKIYEVRTLEFKDNIFKAAAKRNDDWGKTVASRLIDVLDLVVEEARYYDTYRLKFLKPVPVKEDVGRPEDPEIAKAFQKICDYIQESNDCQLSVQELLFVSDKKD